MDALAQAAESVARKYAVLRPHLDERQRRLLLGAEASELGRGGIKAVALATGVHPDTIARGVREAEQAGAAAPGAGAGRGPQEAGRDRPAARGGAEKAGGSRDARGPDVAAGVDNQVDPESGGR